MRRKATIATLTALSGLVIAGSAAAVPAIGAATGMGADTTAATAANVATRMNATNTTAAAATVNMEAVIKAAMWDPYKPGQDITPGSGPSVKTVEQALAAKGLLAKKYVDGHFGTSTVSAYAKYQRSLGYSGLAASGLPGKGSLTKLGTNRYKLTRIISVGAKTSMDGKTVNKRTAAMIRAAERRAGTNFTLTQGSYHPGTGASAGTHDGGGVVDVSVHGLPSARAAVKALRQVGFAAWHRLPSQGPWAAHIHAVAISDTDMSPAAQKQAGAYFEGRNGLANNGKDTGPDVKKVTWEEYKRG